MPTGLLGELDVEVGDPRPEPIRIGRAAQYTGTADDQPYWAA
ncbi:hypothetical protein [Streptomyces sp. C3-3]|nr:hypothetical protein [Streptomyces sp. C3-3]